MNSKTTIQLINSDAFLKRFSAIPMKPLCFDDVTIMANCKVVADPNIHSNGFI